MVLYQPRHHISKLLTVNRREFKLSCAAEDRFLHESKTKRLHNKGGRATR